MVSVAWSGPCSDIAYNHLIHNTFLQWQKSYVETNERNGETKQQIKTES